MRTSGRSSAPLRSDVTSFGDCPDDEPLRAAWNRFCHRWEPAGDKVAKDANRIATESDQDFRVRAALLGEARDR
jgi:hypothetical protein